MTQARSPPSPQPAVHSHDFSQEDNNAAAQAPSSNPSSTSSSRASSRPRTVSARGTLRDSGALPTPEPDPPAGTAPLEGHPADAPANRSADGTTTATRAKGSTDGLHEEQSDRRALTIAFLKCDQLPDEAIERHGEYQDVIHNLFDPVLKSHTSTGRSTHPSKLKLNTLAFDVRRREYPSERQLQTQIDAVVISGSFQDGADTDAQWILRLAGFLVMLADDYPRIRQVGICFGMQIIARAFGPCKIVSNPKGWEIGSTPLKLTPLGAKLLNPPGSEERDTVTLQQMHSDIAQGPVPEGFELLASSDITPIHGLVKFYPPSSERGPPGFLHSTYTNDSSAGPPEPFSNVHIIGVQGHPEWHEGIILPLIEGYLSDGKIDSQTAETARQKTKEEHDGLHVGRALIAVLGFV